MVLLKNDECTRRCPDERAVDRDFAAFMLNTNEMLAAAAAHATGATRPRISRSKLEQLRIPVPPLPEQRRIAARLREQLAEVTKARAAGQAQLDAVQALPAAIAAQRAFARRIQVETEASDQAISAFEEKLQALDQLPAALLREAFSGRV